LFTKWLPDRQRLEANAHLRWLRPLLGRPWLWHLNRRAVALGLAVGVFIGFIIPMGLQAPIAAAFAVWLRGNLAAAVLSTLVTNPFTVAPVYFAAYRVGAFLTGAEPTAWSSGASVMGKIASIGGPLMLGLTVMGVIGAALAYFGTHALWRLLTARAWQRRLHERAAKRPSSRGTRPRLP
jgi:hypothetical protein